MAIIGIDLGTTNSLVSVFKDGRIQLIPNAFGEYLTPSVVSFGDKGEVYVGKIAKEMLVTRPKVTFCEFKRNMGTDHEYRVGHKSYRAEELSAFVLRRLKEDAEAFLGEPVTEAVISVPAYFDDNKRCATKNAGKLAGLVVERLINEPSAAALNYHVNSDEMEDFIVFDFGGGTLDVSVVEAFENMVEIRAVAGDNHLGGKDFNEVIAEEFYRRNRLSKRDFTDEEQASILKAAEELKKELTGKNEAEHTLYLKDKEYVMKLTNQELICISTSIFQRISKPISRVLNDCGMGWDDIDHVILAGGSSKMPVIRKYIQSLAGDKVMLDANPDECIALGVGMAAAIKERTGDVKDMILSDICPFSLGTSIYDGTMSVIIERNATLPCKNSRYYVTVKDFQTEIDFEIYQGENLRAKDNLLLGTLKITDIPSVPKGETGAWVTFMYDINGILDIQIDGERQSVHKVIVNKQMGLTEREIEQRVKELKKLTLHPVEQEENRLLIEKAERLYQEANPEIRNSIQEMLRGFLLTLQKERGQAVRAAYTRFSLFLDMVEAQRIDLAEFDENFWTEDEEDVSGETE